MQLTQGPSPRPLLAQPNMFLILDKELNFSTHQGLQEDMDQPGYQPGLKK